MAPLPQSDDHMADALELVHTAKVFVSYRAVDIVQECIQIHGGIGLTWEHDMHLFLRRVGSESGAVWNARAARAPAERTVGSVKAK